MPRSPMAPQPAAPAPASTPQGAPLSRGHNGSGYGSNAVGSLIEQRLCQHGPRFLQGGEDVSPERCHTSGPCAEGARGIFALAAAQIDVVW